MAEFEKVDMMVVGNHGRKGPKKDETICGSAIEHLAKNFKFPVIIIKDYKPRSQKHDGCLRYGIMYDTSSKSKQAFAITLNMMKKGDKLAVICVKDNNRLTPEKVEHDVKI